MEKTQKLVERVNELFHDFHSEKYHYANPSLKDKWTKKWRKISHLFFNSSKPLTIIDIGTGTGYLPIEIGGFFDKRDIFICSDISKKILDTAKKNIKEHEFNCKFKYVKLNSSSKLPFKKNSADIIIMSEVLHHIQDIKGFTKEIDRVLRRNGFLCIGREPNKRFFQSKIMKILYRFFIIFFNTKQFLKETFKDTFLIRFLRDIHYSLDGEKKRDYNFGKSINKKINDILIKEKLIKRPLKQDEMSKLIDVMAEEGFYAEKIIPNYKIVYYETSDDLFLARTNNKFAKKIVKIIEKKFPKENSAFFIVLKKI